MVTETIRHCKKTPTRFFLHEKALVTSMLMANRSRCSSNLKQLPIINVYIFDIWNVRVTLLTHNWQR